MSPGSPASVAKDAAVASGAPCVVAWATVLKPARAGSLPGDTVA
ncbi:hypothetical protein ACE1SV_43470 [Streptomyces sennicomposti]